MTTQSQSLSKPTTPFSFPKTLLLIEGLAVLTAATFLYFQQGYGWLLFLLLFLLPDLAILPYLIDKRLGAIAYNLVHTYTLPLILGAVALVLASPLAIQIALIWLAHIGLDRMIGAGLKYEDGFQSTHLHKV